MNGFLLRDTSNLSPMSSHSIKTKALRITLFAELFDETLFKSFLSLATKNTR